MTLRCRKRIDTVKSALGMGKTPLCGFSFESPRRSPMEDMAGGPAECVEMDALRRRLELLGAESCSDCDADVMGIRCMLTCFESPVGTVNVSSAPGTKGYRDGLLEACCSDVDTVSRAMTASQVMEWYGVKR